jgi:uncharacterized protein (DUF433 family)
MNGANFKRLASVFERLLRYTTRMILEPLMIPLREDAAGVWRVGKTRVTFETVWRAWKEGADAEQIVMRFSALELADVLAVLAFALRQPELVNEYMERVQGEERAGLELIDQMRPNDGLRERLMARSRP